MTITTSGAAPTADQQDEDALQARIQALLARMTLAEKVGQMSQLNVGTDHVPHDLRHAIAAGQVGSVLNAVGAPLVAELQRIAREESRLGIPLLVGRDVIHGFRTIFPIPLGQAASWNPELVREGARIAAAEAAEAGVNWTFAPMIDISRDPRWGRIAESLGEDPWLCSLLGAAMVRGFQGDSVVPGTGIAACAKHFAGYGASESGRDYNTTNIPENELRNVYLPPFHAAVEAGVASLMASFSDIDGVPASANAWLMRQVLREEWGFDGLVVSDWDSIWHLTVHGLAADGADCALEASAAGIDMEMSSTTYRDHLPGLVEKGRVDEALLDAMVANILRVKFRLGLFDEDPASPARPPLPSLEERRSAARQAAVESLVLLRNEGGVLPLDGAALRSIAVIGPLADAPFDQLGTWIFDGDPADAITPLTALRDSLGEHVEIHHARALETSRSGAVDGFPEALTAAEASDVALLFLGEESILSGEAHCRADIRLPGAQEELIEALAATGTPLVLIVQAGRPLVLEAVIEQVDAIVYAWHPGVEGGPAIADVLLGASAPIGKLPVTFPRAVGQVPMYYNHKHTGKPVTPETYVTQEELPPNAPQLSAGNTSYHLDVHHTPRFPFGFGLSYTRFSCHDIAASPQRFGPDGEVEVSATVRNDGDREGVEVVQLYVRDPVAQVTRPVRELKGFQRVRLAPGEARRVSFRLQPEDLAFYGRCQQQVVEPGMFHAWIGGSSETTLMTQFELAAE